MRHTGDASKTAADQNLLTQEQAYDAMFAFLKLHYEALGGDQIGALLGSMALCTSVDDRNKKLPLDEAIWEDWGLCVGKSLRGELNSELVVHDKKRPR